jgi:hypothetical protein
MFLRDELSGDIFLGEIPRATKQSPDGLEEFGIPDKGIVNIFEEKFAHCRRFTGGLLSTDMAIHALKFRTTIETMRIR